MPHAINLKTTSIVHTYVHMFVLTNVRPTLPKYVHIYSNFTLFDRHTELIINEMNKNILCFAFL